jgi:5-deoxy-glucuronate isomerase
MIQPAYFQALGKNNGANSLENHGCKHLEFTKVNLAANTTLEGKVGAAREAILVPLSGKARVTVGDKSFEIGGRGNVFAGLPHSLYLPRGSSYTIEALTKLEAALPSAPSSLDTDAYEIKPDQVRTGQWGTLNYTRHYREILVAPNGMPASSLIVGETITPSGNWSTYPPHKHEVNEGGEVFHEEMYYFRVSSPEGWGLTRHYSPEHGYDTTHTVKDDTILSIPHGYHTYSSAPGYSSYYLWFLAGDGRTQGVKLDPDVGWVQKTVGMV